MNIAQLSQYTSSKELQGDKVESLRKTCVKHSMNNLKINKGIYYLNGNNSEIKRRLFRVTKFGNP